MTIKPSRGNGADTPITIKKYANRRLYNTATSSYVTLENLAEMVRDNQNFVVYDAKTGEDITRSVLTQIIVEEESKGQNLLPIGFLRQLIGLYGDSLGGVVPQYLEYAMQSFTHNEEQMRGMMQSALDGLFPVSSFEELNKRNMAFFENAMSMFNPFQSEELRARAAMGMGLGMTGAGARPTTRPTGEDRPHADPEREIEALKAEIAEMQTKLNRLVEAQKD